MELYNFVDKRYQGDIEQGTVFIILLRKDFYDIR